MSILTIQKTFVSLDTEIRALANPVSPDSFPVAGDIEDLATNAPLLVSRLQVILDDLYYIAGMELMHAAQALDLRLKENPELHLGVATSLELKKFRQVVSFLDKDRILSIDIQKAYNYLKSEIQAN